MVIGVIQNIGAYFTKNEDPRVSDWPMMSSPFYTIGIVATYVCTVKVLGPKLMENRQPFKLKHILLIYNFLQVILSAILVYEFGMSGWFTGEYGVKCQPVDFSTKPNTIRMLYASRLYFFAKFTELLDTVFFVLRKSFRQVSTLHVIHHSIMPLCVWTGLKLGTGVGHATFFGILNSFVHVVMYGYYFLSAIGPWIQPYLWWKKYLTLLQMIQFGFIFIHSSQLFFVECNFPKGFAWTIFLIAVMFYVLFKKFYDKTYVKEKKNE